MDRFERLHAAIEGKPVDRVPVSAWGHFYDKETTAEGLADIMISFQKAYDWDYLKIHARASYHAEGFGYEYAPSRDRSRLHICTSQPIKTVADWRKLRPLSLNHPVLEEQFRAIEPIRKGVKDAPIIMTVFTPLDIADKLVDRNSALLARHIAEGPDAVRHGLSVFAETFAPFVRKLASSGVDGIFFSSKWVNRQPITAWQYRNLAAPYDLQMIREADGLWCNLFHLCQGGVDLGLVKDYPVQIFHWDANAPDNFGYGEGRFYLPKAAVAGGVDAATLVFGSPDDVTRKAVKAIKDTGGQRFVLGPGCSIVAAQTSEKNLKALRSAPETVN